MRGSISFVLAAFAIFARADFNATGNLAFEAAPLEEIDILSTALIPANIVSLFDFDTEVDVTARSSGQQCRVFPGDTAWPLDVVWNFLDLVLGKGALIKTVPLAAPCYNGYHYNQTKCAALTANWTNSYLQ